jgi:dihydrofolate synthase/folylpolyglutamate synthase
MTYNELLSHIFSRGRFGMKPGLERIALILERLGNPQQQLKTVQIAGTNGKGSTGAFLSAIMTAAGYRTAFFSSPHLSSFSERFRINDIDVAETVLHGAAQRVIVAAPPEATFFEIVTAIAFLCFAEEQVDLAILETGMGGRWDATNVADSLLAVITPVSMDHCDYLGDTLAAIAREKAGIIKPGRPVIAAAQDATALAVIGQAAAANGSPLLLADRDFAVNAVAGSLEFTVCGRNFTAQPILAGRFQAGNAAVAIAAALTLGAAGFTVSDAACQEGLAAAHWPGRLELFPGPPRILLDGAHNPAGASALAEALADYPRRKLLLVFGVMADKAWQEVLLTLLPLADLVIAVAPALDRALDTAELAAFCREQGGAVFAAGTVASGLAYASSQAADDDLVLVAGSLFTVGEARAILTGGSYLPIRG